jgi:hypothetical protein
MAKLDRMTAASIEIDIDGIKYFISPLRMKELGELEKWAERQIFKRLHLEFKMLEETGTEIDNDIKLKMIQDCSSKSKDSFEKSREMETLDGLKKVLDLSLRIKHPDISEEILKKIIETEGLDAINEIITNLSYPDADEQQYLKKN